MISTAATATSFFNQPIDEVLAQHIDLFIALGAELKSVAEAKWESVYPMTSSILPSRRKKMMPTGSTTSMHSDFLPGKKQSWKH